MLSLAKNAHKSASLWLSVALAAMVGAEQALPAVAGSLPESVYGWIKLALGVAIPVARVIKQRGVSGDA